MDKKSIVNLGAQLRNTTVKRHMKRSTSGSTGHPFVFYKDRYSTAYMDAVMYNSYTWHDIEIGERQARFWGMPINRKKRREAVAKDFLMNRIRLSAFEISEPQMRKFAQELSRFHPGYAYGYPSLIFEFAQFCDDHGLSGPLKKLKLKGVIVTGEKTVQTQLDLIERVFNTRVFKEYGCTEIGSMGMECKKGNIHVMSPNIIMEIIKDGKTVTDDIGEIVVTELNAKSYPFIRYKTGDLGALLSEKCTCGLQYPLMKIEEGRRDDYIITPDGRKIYDAILAYTIGAYSNAITSFKAVQTSINELELYIVPSQNFNCTVKNALKTDLQNSIHKDLSINIHKVDKIPREDSGKLRYFVSKIN